MTILILNPITSVWCYHQFKK